MSIAEEKVRAGGVVWRMDPSNQFKKVTSAHGAQIIYRCLMSDSLELLRQAAEQTSVSVKRVRLPLPGELYWVWNDKTGRPDYYAVPEGQVDIDLIAPDDDLTAFLAAVDELRRSSAS